ncbi:tyrosine-type recombinase/integrase [Sphingobium subterraneum]|uniref:Integrase n=1 Tax=Sphingobium subterraneum TaxID=627688 RepID=A0A841J2I3_9SPHN|nr:tyrosine-type recombinase/integrase [Sphingobium subterraneum]MBB6123736.1 integrase [Sphingobium subterraneum]
MNVFRPGWSWNSAGISAYTSATPVIHFASNTHQPGLPAEPTGERRFNDIIDAYLASPEWANLAKGTRRTWSGIVERIRDEWADTPAAAWSNPQQLMEIIRWRNTRAHQPRTADHRITVLHHLLSWARLHGEVSINIATNIPRLYRNGTRAEIIWLEDEIARFCAAAPPQIADGMRLAALTGLRCADLIGLTWPEIDDVKVVRITLKSQRRRKRAIIPLTPALRQLLDELAIRHRRPGVNTVLVNSWGRSWSVEGFGHGFNKIRDAFDVRHTDGRKKHLHDVRGTYATRLVLLGLSDQEIGDIMGWSAIQVSEVRKLYVQDDAAVRMISARGSGGWVGCKVRT